MSVLYCDNCDEHIDTDFDAEHFDECKPSFKITWGTKAEKTNPFHFWDYLRLNNFSALEQRALMTKRNNAIIKRSLTK